MKKLVSNKKGWIPSNKQSFALVAIAGVVLVLVLIVGAIFLFRGSFCPKCPDIPECPAQIDPSEVQKIFNEITTINTKIGTVNTEINRYRESCEINVTTVKNELSTVSTQLQEVNNYANSIDTRLEDKSFNINLNIFIGALFGSIFGSLITIGIYFLFRRK